MGYQPPFPSSWPEASETVLADEARYLAEADLYVLSPQMCEVVIAAAQTLTRQDLELLSEDDLPCPAGLVVLPYPVIVQGMTGDLGDDRAYSWRFPSQIYRPGRRGRLTKVPAVRTSAYQDSHGPVRPDSFLNFAASARAQGTPLPPLLLDTVRCVPLEFAATPQQVQALQEYVAAVRRAGDQAREIVAAQGIDENRMIGEYIPGQRLDDPDDTFMLRFLFAFWRLCEQRLAVVTEQEPNHSAQVVAARAGVPADVRVVALRRVERDKAATGGEPGSHEWHHHWVVRVHKVLQWYPSKERHKVIFRGPFVKGDLDKPLLRGDTVTALIR
jgi:hypothetical protein